MLTDVAGIRVGHWTDRIAKTGCTAVLFPEGTVASGEVRGGAPATREFALLDPQRAVDRVDAVMLSGGSVFGLSAADGVVRGLRDQGIGFATPAGPVPIVVGMSLFDLLVGDSSVRPGADKGYRACSAAGADGVETGAVGAGAGAMVGMWRGAAGAMPGGIVSASVAYGDVVVGALVAVNAFGDVDDGTGLDDVEAELGNLASLGGFSDIDVSSETGASSDAGNTALGNTAIGNTAIGNTAIGNTAIGNTVIGVVATNARLDKLGCQITAQGAHDGLARAVFPPHTRVDGDAFVAAATGEVEATVDLVRAMTVLAVERAIRTLAT